jgi:hypothetical protein
VTVLGGAVFFQRGLEASGSGFLLPSCRVAHSATGGDHVFDERDGSASDIGTFGESVGTVRFRLFSHEHRWQAGDLADDGG